MGQQSGLRVSKELLSDAEPAGRIPEGYAAEELEWGRRAGGEAR